MPRDSVEKRFALIPALDIRSGQAVRLTQGLLQSETQFGDPLEIAFDFQRAGAEWIHLVDLDAAFGTGNNRAKIENLIKQLDIEVQLSGGISEVECLNWALSTGCARVNLSASALSDLDWTSTVIGNFGDRVSVALDVRGERISPRGSTSELGDIFTAISKLDDAGCNVYVLTDVDRDGAMKGPNLELLRKVLEFTNTPVVVSGGVSKLEDIQTLIDMRSPGIEGVIVGKALYAGHFTLSEALEVCSQ